MANNKIASQRGIIVLFLPVPKGFNSLSFV